MDKQSVSDSDAETYEIYKRIEAKEHEVYCMRRKLKQKENELLRLHYHFAAPLGSDAFAAASLRYRHCVDYLSSGSYPSIYLAWVALQGAINIAPASSALGVIGTHKPFHHDKVVVIGEGIANHKSKSILPPHITRYFAEVTKDVEKDDVERYCRQMILPEVGMKGQSALKQSSVLIVGCGGIGCPVALYLAAAGVGRLGLVDYDDVEVSNLHRQVLHSEVTVGVPKVDSAAEALQRLNMDLEVSRHNILISPSNIFKIMEPYDVVVDATDNVPTRYLLNDACWLAGKKPLVSGSALKMEGQLTVYGGVRGTEDGEPRPPCYRCLFPTPPPVEAISNCSDSGVLGVVPGLIGVLQALEVIKILMKKNTSKGKEKNKCFSSDSSLARKLLLFDASDCSFRSVSLRSADPNCALCGTNPTITSLGGMDYENLCGVRVHNEAQSLTLLTENDRITVHDYSAILGKETDHILVDVRSEAEFKMCHLPAAINLPMSELTNIPEVVKKAASSSKTEYLPVYVLCRRGNDSQRAVIKFRELLDEKWVIKDIQGGLHEWSEEVDPTFPHY